MNAITQEILRVLKETDGYVSGQLLSRCLGVSRVTVSKHIQELKHDGYGIVSLPRRGHCLERSTGLPLVEEVSPLLETTRRDGAYIFLETVDSTNSYLARLPREKQVHGMVVVADSQTGGRGRMGRQWHSPPGCGLWFSMLLKPEAAPSELPQLALVAGVAVCAALKQVCPTLVPGIKWPNDVLIGRRKVAGILCEMEAEADIVHHVVLGVGVNVNATRRQFPPELRAIATSLREEAGTTLDRVSLLAAILNQLDRDYAAWSLEGLAPLLPRLRGLSVLKGLPVTVEGPRGSLRGVVQGCNADGCLQLQLKDGTVRNVPSGEVHVNWRKQGAQQRSKGKRP